MALEQLDYPGQQTLSGNKQSARDGVPLEAVLNVSSFVLEHCQQSSCPSRLFSRNSFPASNLAHGGYLMQNDPQPPSGTLGSLLVSSRAPPPFSEGVLCAHAFPDHSLLPGWWCPGRAHHHRPRRWGTRRIQDMKGSSFPWASVLIFPPFFHQTLAKQ